MIEKKEMIKARDSYIDQIRAELLGPGSETTIDAEHEIIIDKPTVRYSLGILFPQELHMNAGEEETFANDGSKEDIEVEVEESSEKDSEEKAKQDKESREYREDAEEIGLDEEVNLANQNKPSSMGINFFVKGKLDKLCTQIAFAVYRPALVTDCKVPYKEYEVPLALSPYINYDKVEKCFKLRDKSLKKKQIREWFDNEAGDGNREYSARLAMYKLVDQLRGYVRMPKNLDVEIHFNDEDYVRKDYIEKEYHVEVSCVRREIEPGYYSITLMLLNKLHKDDLTEAIASIMQPKIVVDTKDNSFTFAVAKDFKDFKELDEEEQSLELQYRNKKNYGSGLGTTLAWDINDDGNGIVYSDFFPVKEIPSMDFSFPTIYNIDSKVFSLDYLSDLNETLLDEKIELLEKFVDGYGQWINSLKNKLSSLDVKYHVIAVKNIEGCEKALTRMQKGVNAIRNNKMIADAFQLANRAMFMQRMHIKLQENTSDVDRYPDDEKLEEIFEQLEELTYRNARTLGILSNDGYAWRPFQLAFILMSICSITDDKSEDRDIVDLIWFPTGGGKTEAYLGLTALSIFYRRMAYPDNCNGTTVIMRYTLRLLAAQQFTRAATLICACELIRRDATSKKPEYHKYNLGKQEITIGLWIGSQHTASHKEDAAKCLNKLKEATIYDLYSVKAKYNKFQMLKCPWCGTKMVKDVKEGKLIGEFGYTMDKGHFSLRCPNSSCSFDEGDHLPVQVVDYELYNNPPTLLFGTVDKFAMMTWKEEVGRFFGVNTNNRAPELIIQDELHLISGPLGSIVGLYESAIDKLCTQKGVKPKIVASTATIRRAKEQCACLYNRNVAQFPHPALDAEDSFFAREQEIDYEKGLYGRKYVGLLPAGKTKAMMEVRSIASLLQRANILPVNDEIKDKFWTLTAYFNSLKDLGKCSVLVEDDVKDSIKKNASRLLADKRIIISPDELTSRVTTTELNETLDKLEKLVYSKENIANHKYASNVLLATNMISVGIDVARLNVMLMVGQPKLTSEYIQASSRVGRSYPGVAFIMYDSTKSRDRSHYEQFKSYHESFYKYVEPTGLTPFSKPARERALHAVAIAILRNIAKGLATEKDAAKFNVNSYKSEIAVIKDFLITRNSSIIKRVNGKMKIDSNLIADEIDSIFAEWESLASKYGVDNFTYGMSYMMREPEKGKGRLLKSFNSSPYNDAIDTLTSMRSVEAGIKSSVLIWW